MSNKTVTREEFDAVQAQLAETRGLLLDLHAKADLRGWHDDDPDRKVDTTPREPAEPGPELSTGEVSEAS